MYKYIHDASARVVYRFPSEPDVFENKDSRGNRVAWHASMEILITRADNTLTEGKWRHATSDYPSQSFDAGKTRPRTFFLSHAPRAKKGEAISQEQYEELQSQYETVALGQSTRVTGVSDAQPRTPSRASPQ